MKWIIGIIFFLSGVAYLMWRSGPWQIDWVLTYWVLGIILAIFLTVMFFMLYHIRKKNKKATDDDSTKKEDPSEKSKTKEKPKSKTPWWVWVLLLAIFGPMVLGVILFIIVFFVESQQPKEKVWVRNLAVMPGSREGYANRDFSRAICDVKDSPARFEMACSNSNGKDIESRAKKVFNL